MESQINAFSAGELAPNVYGRTDLQQYAQGAAELDNMVVLPAGSVRKRPGTRLWYKVPDADITNFGRLCRFTVSDEEDVLVLVTSTHIKILRLDNATPLSTTAFTLASTEKIARRIRRAQSKFDCVFVSRAFAPAILSWDGTTFTYPTTSIEPPPIRPTFAGATADKRPGAVAFVDERVVFAGTNQIPNGLWGSAIKALDNFIGQVYWTKERKTIAYRGAASYVINAGEFYPEDAQPGSPGATDSKAFNFFANLQGSTDAASYNFLILDGTFIDVQWIIATNTLQNGFLILGSRAGLYGIIGGGSAGAITAASPVNQVRLLSSSGCSDVQGLVVNNYLVYVDASKRTLRVAAFNLQADQYDTPRLTDLSSHLFDDDVVEIHYQQSPNSTLWVLLANGKVLAFSYDASGSLAAWTPMDFGGGSICKSIEVLRGAKEDVPVFLMYNAEQDEYTIERMMPFNEDDQDEYWFVDSGVRKYNATAFTVVDGLDHLEGEEVQVWADGGAHPPRTVESGEITLNRAVNTAIVGRQYTAKVTTLPIQVEQDKRKRASRIFVRFLETLGAKAGGDEFTEIVPFMAGNFEMGAKPVPFSGIKEIPYFGRHDNDAQVTVFSDAPTPFHILNFITRLEIYG